ncbi:MAG: trypsin-like serine protease [Alcanivoracaceae bacterium]|nr:trypsin-like serine protease [Alcanivoracaceae bacterium]
MKIFKIIILAVLTMSPLYTQAKTVYLDSEQNADDTNKSDDSITVKRPQIRSWTDLQQAMQGNTMTATELNVQDCSGFISKLTKIGSYYQHILYSSYKWETYKATNGINCIKLIKPKIGYLDESEAVALLSASVGYHFEQLGFWKEAGIYNKTIKENLSECKQDDTVGEQADKAINISKEDLYEDMETENNNKPIDNEKFLLDTENLDTPADTINNSDKTEYKYNDILTDNACVVPAENIKLNNTNESLKVVIGAENRVPMSSLALPWMAYIKRKAGNLSLNCKTTGSGFYINPNTVITAAHNIKYKDCTNTNWSITANGIKEFTQSNLTMPQWDNNHGNSFSDHIYDFAALKMEDGLFIPLFPAIFGGQLFPVEITINDLGQTFGYPYRVNGQVVSGTLYTEERSVIDDLNVLNNTGPGSHLLVSHYFDQTAGQSGGPLFFSHSSQLTAPIIGIMTISASGYNFATAVDINSSPHLDAWANERPPNITIDIDSPSYLELLDWDSIDNFTFNADVSGTTRFVDFNDVNTNLIWESDINGVFGTGTSVTALEAKAKLRSGTHMIKLSIDNPQYLGEAYVLIDIIGPQGLFTMPSNYCIINLQLNPNNCNIPVSWQTTNSPNTIVFNNRTQTVFATGQQGNNLTFTATKNQDTELVLYASTDKVYDIDRAVLSAKVPKGILNSASSACSLKPSPVNPHDGTLRNPKATPSGCGTTLSWSNVRWASPSIYYRLIGSGTWQYLHQIPCTLNGAVCNGSINTDDISPELIPLNGVEFKLLQFNNTNSGVLNTAFTVTAHRFADSYEYDGGDITEFTDIATVGFPTNMVIDNTLSTKAQIGVPQHNHSFHSPAVYDSTEDIDTVQIRSADFAVGKMLSVKVFNMANGLNVNMQLKCAGIINGGIFDGQSGIFDFENDPTSAIITDPVTGTRTMDFQVTRQTRDAGKDVDCLYNRVVITRTAGTPNENLTYSVVVNPLLDPPDIYEEDDDIYSTTPLVMNSGFQDHNFNDDSHDWVSPSFIRTNNECPTLTCNIEFQDISNENICYQRFILIKPLPINGLLEDVISPIDNKICNITNRTYELPILHGNNRCGYLISNPNRLLGYFDISEESGQSLENKKYKVKLNCIPSN